MTLAERIAEVCPIQGRRYERLGGVARDIATRGIRRHLNACDRWGIEPDRAAIREIIDDALCGRAVFEETDARIAERLQGQAARIQDQPWIANLLTLESFTSQEVGELAGRPGPDVLSQLKVNQWFRVITLERREGSQLQRYRLERR